MPKARPIEAMRDPSRPRPRIESVWPCSAVPMVSCQPPSRMRWCSCGMCRISDRISPQASSGVAYCESPPRVCETVMPRSFAAATSRVRLCAPVTTMSFKAGRRSISVRGIGMRSRSRQTTSKSASARAASSSVARLRSKTTSSHSGESALQSAILSATRW